MGYKNETIQKDTIPVSFHWLERFSFPLHQSVVPHCVVCYWVLSNSTAKWDSLSPAFLVWFERYFIIEDAVKSHINACPLMTNTARLSEIYRYCSTHF